MNSTHRIQRTLGALCILGSIAGQSPTPIDPRLPYRNGPNSTEELNVRVVDGRSGQPIAGAHVQTIDERKHPARGQYWSDNQARTDRDGFARIRRPGGYWIVVEAPGYAVAAWSGKTPGRDGILTMYPGLDVPVQLRNHLGELQPGAGLGFCVGCGHSPDVRYAITGDDGVAWLRGISRARGDDDAVGIGDLYPLGSGLDGDYDGLDPWFVGGPPVQRYCSGAPDLVGRIVDADGDPAKDLVVRQYERHRGPATRTDQKGEFVLVSPFNGSRQTSVLWQHDYPEFELAFPPTQKITLQLPALNPKKRKPAPKTVPVTFKILHADTKRPIPNLWFTARPVIGGPDCTETEETDEQGLLTVELPIGDAVLWTTPEPKKTAPDADLFGFEHVLQVGEANPQATLLLKPHRRVALRVEGLPEDGDAWLATSTGERGIDLERVDGVGRATIRVPADPSAVHLLAHGRRHVVRVPKSTRGEWTIRWPRAPRYSVFVRDEAGRPVAAKVAFHDRPARLSSVAKDQEALRTSASGEVVIPARHGFGTVFALIVPDRDAHLPLVHRIDLPPMHAIGPDTEPTLDPIVLPARATPPLRLIGPRIERWSAHLMRSGLYYEHAIGADGTWSGPQPRTGDWVVLDPPETPEDHVALRVRKQLTGPGPWTVGVPAGTLQLAFESPQGNPVGGVHVYLDDQSWLSERSTLQIDHVPDAPIRLTCGHPEHGACVVEVPTGPSTRRRVIVRLPGR